MLFYANVKAEGKVMSVHPSAGQFTALVHTFNVSRGCTPDITFVPIEKEAHL